MLSCVYLVLRNRRDACCAILSSIRVVPRIFAPVSKAICGRGGRILFCRTAGRTPCRQIIPLTQTTTLLPVVRRSEVAKDGRKRLEHGKEESKRPSCYDSLTGYSPVGLKDGHPIRDQRLPSVTSFLHSATRGPPCRHAATGEHRHTLGSPLPLSYVTFRYAVPL